MLCDFQAVVTQAAALRNVIIADVMILYYINTLFVVTTTSHDSVELQRRFFVFQPSPPREIVGFLVRQSFAV